ncbi:MAG: type II toxin-antitoxin system VapC family toxin [Bacillota bacterium]
MKTVIVDAGAILALLNADSRIHRQAREMLKALREREAVPLLTNFIVGETFTLLSDTLGPDAGRTWLRHNIWPVERVNEADEKRAREILLENGGPGGVNISYTDAATIAVMERLGITGIFTFNPVFEERGYSPLPAE